MADQTILVLDDSESLLELAKMFIEELCGQRALTFRTLKEVQSYGERVLACRMAILDINLGPNEPSGVEVYHWLRKSGYKAPIYFLTGHAHNYPPVTEAVSIGDAEVLSKPLSAENLMKIIRG